MQTQRQLVEQATGRLRRSGFQVVVVSLANGRHTPAWGWLDLIAVNGGQRSCLAVCVDRPPGCHRADDPLPRVLGSAGARAWPMAGGQLEVWRVFPKTRRGRPAKIDRHPITLASLGRPAPPQPTLSWAEAFNPGGRASS